MPSYSEIEGKICIVADHLRGDHEAGDYEDAILPFTLLRRLDCMLEPTREKVRETERKCPDTKWKRRRGAVCC